MSSQLRPLSSNIPWNQAKLITSKNYSDIKSLAKVWSSSIPIYSLSSSLSIAIIELETYLSYSIGNVLDKVYEVHDTQSGSISDEITILNEALNDLKDSKWTQIFACAFIIYLFRNTSQPSVIWALVNDKLLNSSFSVHNTQGFKLETILSEVLVAILSSEVPYVVVVLEDHFKYLSKTISTETSNDNISSLSRNFSAIEDSFSDEGKNQVFRAVITSISAALNISNSQLLGWTSAHTKTIINTSITLIESHTDVRDFIIKTLIPSLVKFSVESTVLSVWQSLVKWKLSNQSVDSLSQSAAICLLISESKSLSPFNILRYEDGFWEIVLRFMQDSEALVRKRGAFILEQLIPNNNVKDVAKATHDSIQEFKQKRQNKKNIRDESNQVIVMNKKSVGKTIIDDDTAIWVTYLTVYHQAEDCKQDHLVTQVWSLLENLFQYCYSPTPPAPGTPLMTFSWIVILFKCLLHGQVPSIRKLALFKLFSNALPLNPNDVIVLNWIANDLMNLIDDSSYYPQRYTTSNETSENLQSYPGALIPQFILGIMTNLSQNVKSFRGLDSLKRFTSQLVSSIVRVSSFTAAKWIFKAFSIENHYRGVLTTSSDSPINGAVNPYELFWEILSLEDIQKLKSFYHRSIVCSNRTVRNQILHGYLPLLISGYPVNNIHQPDYSLMKFLIMDVGCLQLLIENIELRRLFISKAGLMITPRMGDYSFRSIPDNEGDLSFDSGYLLAIFIVLFTSDDIGSYDAYMIYETGNWYEALKQQGNDIILSGNRLATHSYVSLSSRMLVISYLAGIGRIISDASKLQSFKRISVSSAVTHIDKSAIWAYVLSVLTQTLSSMQLKDVNNLTLWGFYLDALGAVAYIISSLEYQMDASYDAIVSSLLNILQPYLSPLVSELNDVGYLSQYMCIQVIASVMPYFTLAAKRSNISLTEETLSIVSNVCKTLTLLEPVDKCIFDKIDKEDDISYGQVKSIEVEIHNQFQHYSRYVTSLMELKWVSLRACYEFISSIKRFPTNHTSLEPNNYYNDYLAIAIKSIESSTEIALVHILHSVRLLLSERVNEDSSQFLFVKNNVDIDMLESLLGAAWRGCMDTSEGSGVSMIALQSFIDIIFCDSIVTYFNIHRKSICLDYFEKIVSLGMQNNRSHVIQYLTSTLYQLFATNLECCLDFFPVLHVLLLYRETSYDDESISDAMNAKQFSYNISANASVMVNGMVLSRILILSFLEDLGNKIHSNYEFKSSLSHYQQAFDELGIKLLNLNLQPTFVSAAIIGSPLFGEKLRCWQTLCVMGKYMSRQAICDNLSQYFSILTHICAHPIRVHIEIFGGIIATRFPELFYDHLKPVLSEFNHQQQTLASYFIILGHFVACEKSDNLIKSVTMQQQTRSLIDLLKPWLACANGLPRAIAQYLMTYLIPSLDSPSVDDKLVYQFLTENKESQRIIARQDLFFKNYGLSTLSTVAGIVSLAHKQHISSELIATTTTQGYAGLPINYSSDFIAEHLLTILLDMVKETNGITNSLSNDPSNQNEIANSLDENYKGQVTLQTKRIPLQDLCLQLAQEAEEWLSRQNLGFGVNSKHAMVSKGSTDGRDKRQQARQNIVVVASLLTKNTNVAGIARTSEIFSAEALIVSNRAVTKSPDFQSIAVGALLWLPTYEVPPTDTAVYLRNARAHGYTVVAVEQTDSSIPLQDVVFPEKCVLLLGREKEGIPIDLLQEVDMCVEVPQFGIIRSLNVHVCASIILWEYTRQHALKRTSE